MEDTTATSDIQPINTDKLLFYRKDHKNVNMIYLKAFGTQYEKDVETVMVSVATASKIKSPAMAVVDMREMKATMYKNIAVIANYALNDLKRLNLLFVVYKHKSIADYSNLAGIFGGYKVFNISLDDYKSHLEKINNTAHFMILIDGSTYTSEAGAKLDDPFDPFNQVLLDFADKLGEAYRNAG